MYSRSYGFIEPSEKNGSFTVPPDYHGNLYRKPTENEQKMPEIPKEELSEHKEEMPAVREEKKPPAPSGLAGGFLERLTAEDILLFVFLYSLLRGENEESGNVLGLILALLLL